MAAQIPKGRQFPRDVNSQGTCMVTMATDPWGHLPAPVTLINQWRIILTWENILTNPAQYNALNNTKTLIAATACENHSLTSAATAEHNYGLL